MIVDRGLAGIVVERQGKDGECDNTPTSPANTATRRGGKASKRRGESTFWLDGLAVTQHAQDTLGGTRSAFPDVTLAVTLVNVYLVLSIP